MATSEIQITIRRKWWVMPFLYFLTGLYRATGYHPDVGKLANFIACEGFIYSTGRGKKC